MTFSLYKFFTYYLHAIYLLQLFISIFHSQIFRISSLRNSHFFFFFFMNILSTILIRFFLLGISFDFRMSDIISGQLASRYVIAFSSLLQNLHTFFLFYPIFISFFSIVCMEASQYFLLWLFSCLQVKRFFCIFHLTIRHLYLFFFTQINTYPRYLNPFIPLIVRRLFDRRKLFLSLHVSYSFYYLTLYRLYFSSSFNFSYRYSPLS